VIGQIRSVYFRDPDGKLVEATEHVSKREPHEIKRASEFLAINKSTGP
jgi:hypothetical protein